LIFSTSTSHNGAFAFTFLLKANRNSSGPHPHNFDCTINFPNLPIAVHYDLTPFTFSKTLLYEAAVCSSRQLAYTTVCRLFTSGSEIDFENVAAQTFLPDMTIAGLQGTYLCSMAAAAFCNVLQDGWGNG